MSNLIQDLIRDGDLAAWYDFRSGTVDDLSGNGRDCTIVGTPHFNREGLSFSDLSSYLSLPLSAFPSSNSLTIVWFCTFTDANNNDWTRVLGSDDSGGGGYEMRTATDDVIMGYVSGTNQNSNGGGSVPTGVPFMGALTCDESGGSTTQKYYVDGVEKDSTVVASTVNTPDTSLWIGHFAADGLIGSVVSVLFIDRVLNITEIGNIMGETRAQRWPTKPSARSKAMSLINPSASGLVAGWDMRPQGGALVDASGNGNDGAFYGGLFHGKSLLGDHIHLDGAVGSYIDCGNDASLNQTDMTACIWARPITSKSQALLSRYDTTGSARIWGLDLDGSEKIIVAIGASGGVAFAIQATSSEAVLLNSWNHIGFAFEDGVGVVKVWLNGESLAFVDAQTYTALNQLDNSTHLLLGALTSGTLYNFDGDLAGAQYFDAVKSDTEMRDIYLRGAEAIQFKTDWGVPVTVPASVGAGAQLGPFMVDSGAFKLTTDTIEGRRVKVIECVTAGVVYMPVPSWEANQMGSWEFWVRKMDASRLSFMFTASAIGGIATPTNINVDFGTDESIKVKTGFTTILDGGTATAETWHKVKVTRRIDYTFELFVDDVSRGTGASNPLLEGFYMNIEMDAGDKVALADVGGGHSIIKRLGAM